MSISLNQAQLDSFNNLVNAGNYPAAYNHLAGIAENTPGADSRVANWLKVAARINANDGGFIVNLFEPPPRRPAKIWGNRLRSNVFKKYQMDCGGN